MIFGSLVFFFEGNFEGESPDLVSEIGSTDLAVGQPPPVSERHPPRAVAPAQRRRGFLRMTLAALGQESGIIGYPIRRECDEVCGEMEVRRGTEMIFGSLVFFFEGNFEGESPDLVSEVGSTELAVGQPPPVSERHPPRAVAPAQRRRGFLRMTLAALGQESGIIGYPIRRECDEVCGEMEVRHVSAFNCIECRTVLYGPHDGDLFL